MAIKDGRVAEKHMENLLAELVGGYSEMVGFVQA